MIRFAGMTDQSMLAARRSTDGWQVPQNVREEILFVQPTSIDDRQHVAKQMCSTLKLSLPTVIDGLGDNVNQAYAA
jgi:hypothetical protein